MLIGFKARFATPILTGTKVFTLRKKRKLRPRPGEVMYMYTGLRTRYAQMITSREHLISIQTVRMTIRTGLPGGAHQLRITVDGRELSAPEIAGFAILDGFADLDDFVAHWTQGYKKRRVGALLEMYHWTGLRY